MMLVLCLVSGCGRTPNAALPQYSYPIPGGVPSSGECSGLPVFPGAQGFGTTTTAGRGGDVAFVTSLADSGAGSLRAALEYAGPRIVIFRVAGTIELESPLEITEPYLTLAGQTAPGGGITIKNMGLSIRTHDVLIQHLRIRPGNAGAIRGERNDAIELLGPHAGSEAGAYNVVIDHVSMSWSEDEIFSTWYAGVHDVTVSYCILSEALAESRHPEGYHSTGMLIGRGSNRVSVHHCLFAHNGYRNPTIQNNGLHEITNNVIYDWGLLATKIWDAEGTTFVNVVGNTYVAGPSRAGSAREVVVNPTKDTPVGLPHIYLRGNLGPSYTSTDAGAGEDEWSALTGSATDGAQPAPTDYRVDEAYETCLDDGDTATAAYAEVMAEAGATAPRRDAVDQRVLLEVRTKGGGIIDDPMDVGGYPQMQSGSPPPDRDGDGIPDTWEAVRGLDPDDPTDAQADRNDDGYPNIEEYLHSLL
jgi:pectate lyase